MMTGWSLPLKGSCHCKAVHFTIDAAPMFVNCCHCRDCQRLSGSAFALNAMVEAKHVVVVSDIKPSTQVDNYDEKSEGPPSKSTHCATCKTFLWGTAGFLGDDILFVRAGTLQDNEQIHPDAHFFVRSKHPWVQIPEGVRTYETLPTDKDGPLWSADVSARIRNA